MRDCDDGDELYAEFVLGSRDIQMAGVPYPRYLTPMMAILSGIAGCNYGLSSSKENGKYFSGIGESGAAATFLALIQQDIIAPIIKKGLKKSFTNPSKFIVFTRDLIQVHIFVGIGSYTACYLWQKS